MKKYIKYLIIASTILVSACGDSEFNRRAAKYGFNTEEERYFLCFGMGVYNDNMEIRLAAAATGIAYSRYLQKQRTGYDSRKLTPEHSALQARGYKVWERMDPADIQYLSKECVPVVQKLLPKMATELQDSMAMLGL
ncbi:MAG: hypothetical protein II942_03495 [Alphaproteobacteria bacterium]|nr:hypothetical protein [Alphaproteobacteria bacterium]